MQGKGKGKGVLNSVLPLVYTANSQQPVCGLVLISWQGKGKGAG